jgi:glycosyltransferase involved in cell wall biosynthesis
VTVVTPYFPPERGAPQQRWAELVRLLGEEGLDVDVLTNWPHYPHGTTYAGYRWRVKGVEWRHGIKVDRIGNIQAAHRGFLPRLVDQLSSSVALALTLALRRGIADWLLLEVPPVFAALPAAVGRLRDRRMAVYVSDLWPESPVGMGLIPAGGLADRAIGRLTRWLYRSAEVVFTTSDAQRDHCRRRTDSPCYAMHSAVDPDRFEPRAETDRERAGFRLLYLGTLGLAHGLEHLIEAAPGFPEGCEVLMVGDGAERPRLVELASRSRGETKVLDPVSPEQVPDLLREVDVGIVSLRRTSAFETVLPSKLFEYLAAGLPVLVVGEGEAARLVTEERVGFVATPEDPSAIAVAVRQLASLPPEERRRMGERGRSLVEGRHSRRAIARRMADVLKQPVSRQAQPWSPPRGSSEGSSRVPTLR